MKALVSAPFYILWAFIPSSYLQKEQRMAKIICMGLTVLLAAVEICFIS